MGCFSQPILKLPSERCACAPQYFVASTSIGPKVSVSVRVFVMAILEACGLGIGFGGLIITSPRPASQTEVGLARR